ncbi:hypothetical protein [Candidatus Albibeggiatoa sp. nov. NOAA]|uniref:NifB/NifX family molybdenum-iron cluster-binding protein n=1 Tax=Candidatus Albibeggiatoa sp. nov. NOAA TaxID=3162724 RepID=UPI0032F61F0A|nr:hypothetical protein [Thiotrichaceae bacterium]
MRIAVASRDGETVTGHIGKCASWIIFAISHVEQASEPTVTEIERITLPKQFIFHYYKDEQPHPLQNCVAVIGASAGESFKRKMQRRGIEAVMTSESDPAQAVLNYACDNVTPPKPRPIGELICKMRDAFSSD